jgi:hypothetical protein
MKRRIIKREDREAERQISVSGLYTLVSNATIKLAAAIAPTSSRSRVVTDSEPTVKRLAERGLYRVATVRTMGKTKRGLIVMIARLSKKKTVTTTRNISRGPNMIMPFFYASLHRHILIHISRNEWRMAAYRDAPPP